MYRIIVELLRDYLPAGQEFVIRNLTALAAAKNSAQLASFLILLVTSTGIFMPLEVALNRVWRFPNNRSYLGNQIIALGAGFCLWNSFIDFNCAERRKSFSASYAGLWPRIFLDANPRFHDCESLRDYRQHGHLLPDLLVAAEWQSSGQDSASGRDHHGTALGNTQIFLHPAVAAVEFPGSIRAFRNFRQHDVLGVLVRIAAVDRRASLRAKNIPERKLDPASIAFDSD